MSFKVISITPTGHWRVDAGELRSKLAITKNGAYTLGDGRVFTIGIGFCDMIGGGLRYETLDELLDSPVPDDPTAWDKTKRAVIVDIDGLIPISPTLEHTNPMMLAHEADAIDQVTSRTSIGESGEADARADKMLAVYRILMMCGLFAGLIFSAVAAWQSLSL